MKRFWAIILCGAALLPALLTSCEKSVELDYLTKQEIPDGSDGPDDGRTEHALLLYFVGTGLDSYFGRNIDAVRQAVGQNILGNNRIVYFRRLSGTTWAISEIYYDSTTGKSATEVLKTYEDADLSDMGLYLSEMIRLVPAEKYGMVLGGHGSGWMPKSLGSTWNVKYSAMSARTAHASHTAHFNPFGEAPCEGAAPTRFFGESSVNFDISEIAAWMEETGVDFEYLIFDDCFMSNIEALYDMRRAADYIIASPCEIMAEGFPYQYVIPQLFADGGPDLEGVCRAFYDFYTNYSYPSGCVAMTVCSELDALAEAYRNLAAGPTREVDAAQLQYYEGLSRHVFYDFAQYAEALSDSSVLLDAFREQFDRTFPESCRLHTPSYYSAYNNIFNTIDSYSGVTVSEPADRNEEMNRQTEWYRATH